MSDEARLYAAAALTAEADATLRAVELVLDEVPAVGSITGAIADARKAIERVSDGLCAAAEIDPADCPYCASDERCALHIVV